MRFLICICFILAGCAQGVDKNPYVSKIQNWQFREAQCPPTTLPVFKHNNFHTTICDFVYRLPKWTYKKDTVDYWQTSRESVINPIGDCEDQAIRTYRAILDSFQDYDIDVRLRVIDRIYDHHMIVIVYHNSTAYQIDACHISYEQNYDIIVEFDISYIF